MIGSGAELVALAGALGAAAAPLTPIEAAALERAGPMPSGRLDAPRGEIRAGGDPLGEAFCAIRGPGRRRSDGAIYTPAPLVRAMLDRAGRHRTPR